MNDKNYERLTYRLPHAGNLYSGIAAVIFTCLLPGIAIAEPEIENSPLGQTVILDNLVLDSQPLNVNAAPASQEAELATALEPEVISPAPMQLALAEHTDNSETGATKEPGIIDAVSPLSVADGEASQMPFALMLALLALIAVVPMSRRH